MMSIPLIILVLAIVVGFYLVAVFNSLQLLKTQIQASIQEIGNQLKRQMALIPNLETSVKSYLQHESNIYEMISKARVAVSDASRSNSMADIEKASDQLQAVIPQIKVVVESNPELKANTTIIKFMDELTDTADKLMYSRRTLIDLTQSYNAKLVTFPSNLVASTFGFKPESGLITPTSGAHVEVSQAETQDVKVDLK